MVVCLECYFRGFILLKDRLAMRVSSWEIMKKLTKITAFSFLIRKSIFVTVIQREVCASHPKLSCRRKWSTYLSLMLCSFICWLKIIGHKFFSWSPGESQSLRFLCIPLSVLFTQASPTPVLITPMPFWANANQNSNWNASIL